MPNTLRVLLIDDNPSSLLMVSEGLQQRIPKSNIVTVPSAEAGLEHLKANAFDIILCGIQQPGMTCREFLRAVRQLKGDPVILITAGLTRSEALREGAYGCIEVALESKTLTTHIGAVIEKALLVRRLREINAQSMKLSQSPSPPR